MTLNKTKHVQNWTKKHEEFCLQHCITPAAKLLWQWLMRQETLGDEAEPDLKEFNEWVARHRGKGYSRPTLKAALEQLKSLRVIQIIKKFTWRIFRLVVRPLEWLFPKKTNKFQTTKVKLATNRVINFYLEKKFQNRSKTFKSQPSNPQFSDAGSKQQQQSPLIQENLSILDDAGITFKPTELEVLDRPTNEIKLALIMFELRGGSQEIENPEGWIRTCLRERYWEEGRNYEALLNRLGNLTIWSELFPDATSKPITLFGLDINSAKYIRTAP